MNLREVRDRIGVRPERLALLLAVLLVAWGCWSIYARILRPCSPNEKVVLSEFPQYGGRVVGKDIDVYGDEVNFVVLQYPPPGCALEFSVPQPSPQRVSAYYEEKLAVHGWVVTRSSTGAGGELEGTRNGFRYEVFYFRLAGSDATEVRVLVYRA